MKRKIKPIRNGTFIATVTGGRFNCKTWCKACYLVSNALEVEKKLKDIKHGKK